MTVSHIDTVALGTLARQIVLFIPGTSQAVSGTLIKASGVLLLRSPDTDDGPFLFGVSTGNLTIGDIKAAIENDGPSGPTHSGQTERSTLWRHIRIIGVLSNKGNANLPEQYILEYEKVVKLGWSQQDGGYKFWVYNLGLDQVSGADIDQTAQEFVIYDRD